jgi:hypothetical protein
MLLLLLCFALAYCIQGAASQAWADGRATVGKGRTWASAKADTIRTGGSRGARVGLGVGLGLLGVAKGLWWAGVGTGSSLWAGGKAGWGRGRARGRQIVDDRRGRARRVRLGRPPQEPSLWHFVKGECPVCHHTLREAADGQPGCRCDVDAETYPCACALRHRPDPDPAPVVDPARPPAAGGDGPAASTDPDRPEPVDSRPPDTTPTAPDPAPTPEETPVTITGEAADLRSALDQVAQMRAKAVTYLDTAAEATADAGELTAAAERLGATLANAGMDQASQGAVAQLREQAGVLAGHATGLSQSADSMSAACDNAERAIAEWLPVAERMNALGAAPDSGFVAGHGADTREPAPSAA